MMLEIGLNGGHSALLCLLANQNLTFVAVDISSRHEYVKRRAAGVSSGKILTPISLLARGLARRPASNGARTP